jgi:hypothetical protein
MISQQEKARLMHAHSQDCVCASAILAKCTMSLMLLVGIAAVGAGISFDHHQQAQSSTGQIARVSTASH